MQGPTSMSTQEPPSGPHCELHWLGLQSQPHSTGSQVIPIMPVQLAKHIDMLQPPVELDVMALELTQVVADVVEAMVVADDDDAPPEHWQRSFTHEPVWPSGAQTRSLHSVWLHVQSHWSWPLQIGSCQTCGQVQFAGSHWQSQPVGVHVPSPPHSVSQAAWSQGQHWHEPVPMQLPPPGQFAGQSIGSQAQPHIWAMPTVRQSGSNDAPHISAEQSPGSSQVWSQMQPPLWHEP